MHSAWHRACTCATRTPTTCRSTRQSGEKRGKALQRRLSPCRRPPTDLRSRPSAPRWTRRERPRRVRRGDCGRWAGARRARQKSAEAVRRSRCRWTRRRHGRGAHQRRGAPSQRITQPCRARGQSGASAWLRPRGGLSMREPTDQSSVTAPVSAAAAPRQRQSAARNRMTLSSCGGAAGAAVGARRWRTVRSSDEERR